MYSLSRRHMLFTVLKANETKRQEVLNDKSGEVHESKYNSSTQKFSLTTKIKDDDKSVTMHQIVEWYDPISKEYRKDELYKLYILAGESM